jgi:hypothetical protein
MGDRIRFAGTLTFESEAAVKAALEFYEEALADDGEVPALPLEEFVEVDGKCVLVHLDVHAPASLFAEVEGALHLLAAHASDGRVEGTYGDADLPEVVILPSWRIVKVAPPSDR